MNNNNYHKIGNAPLFHVLLSTGLGTGFIPIAPGIAGALAALGIWYLLYLYFPFSVLTIVTCFLIIGTIAIGVWTSNVMERYWAPPQSRQHRRICGNMDSSPSCTKWGNHLDVGIIWICDVPYNRYNEAVRLQGS